MLPKLHKVTWPTLATHPLTHVLASDLLFIMDLKDTGTVDRLLEFHAQVNYHHPNKKTSITNRTTVDFWTSHFPLLPNLPIPTCFCHPFPVALIKLLPASFLERF